MLERLFGLSAYGRQLTERVNRKFSETKILLDQTVLQQEALGDASEEALAAAKKQQEEAAALAEAAGRELQKASQIFEDARKQLALQRELAEVQRKQRPTKPGSLSWKRYPRSLLRARRQSPCATCCGNGKLSAGKFQRTKRRFRRRKQSRRDGRGGTKSPTGSS